VPENVMPEAARERFAETARRRRIPLRNQDRIRMRPSMSEIRFIVYPI
jgi:hypothetical protein